MGTGRLAVTVYVLDAETRRHSAASRGLAPVAAFRAVRQSAQKFRSLLK
jgi:hypothetical protein